MSGARRDTTTCNNEQQNISFEANHSKLTLKIVLTLLILPSLSTKKDDTTKFKSPKQ